MCSVPIYDYTAHGDGSEFTLRRNRQAFDWVDIVPARAAVPASQVDLSSELLGVKMKFPIIVAPSAVNGAPASGWRDRDVQGGDRGLEHADDASASSTSIPVAKVAPAAPGGTLWEQFYPMENLAVTQRSMDNYQNARLATTSSSPSISKRPITNVRSRTVNFGGRVGAVAGGGAWRGRRRWRSGERAGGRTGSARYRVNGRRLWYTWQYIDAVRKMVKGKMLIKGILDPEDARLAIEHGADAIIVSNHGGRSMDYGPSTLEVLPEIVAAVNGRIPVLFDSGIRRGADIFKALALGGQRRP